MRTRTKWLSYALPSFYSLPLCQSLVSVLKREPSVIFKAKSNPSVYVLTTQLLLLALQHSYDWPEAIGRVSLLHFAQQRVVELH